MKNKTDIIQYIQNFDYEFASRIEWLKVHINLMCNDIKEIQNALYIFNTVEKEVNRRFENDEKNKYSAIRTILFDSLTYKIILGLSKIFVGEKEFSLLKTINVISQMDEYKNKKEVKIVIKNIRNYVETSEIIRVITTFRDQFFGHLDKICVLSDCRIDSTVSMKRINQLELDQGVKLIYELYNVCFNQSLEYANEVLSEEDIIYTFFWMQDISP